MTQIYCNNILDKVFSQINQMYVIKFSKKLIASEIINHVHTDKWTETINLVC